MFLRNFFPDVFFESLYFPSTFAFRHPPIISTVGGSDESSGNVVGKFEERIGLVDTYIDNDITGQFSKDNSVIGRMNI
jgi:hypothetical protein